MSQKTITIIGIIVILCTAGFLYATRPATVPTEGIATVSQKMPAGTIADPNTHIYRISQDESKVSFSIKEILRDKPFTAVGTTSEVGGDILVKTDPDNAKAAPSYSFGEIKVNAKTFKTDDAKRDGAIARFILKSETAGNEFITFASTGISNFKEGTNGKATFTVNGDMTIAGVTKPVALAVDATITDDTVRGTAHGMIKRSDFSLAVPNLPFIASVDDTLAIDAVIIAHRIMQ